MVLNWMKKGRNNRSHGMLLKGHRRKLGGSELISWITLASGSTRTQKVFVYS